MARILAIDYGKKRTGIAVTDPLKIIATGLTTVLSPELIAFLKKYVEKEAVELFLIGDPRNLDGSDTDGTPLVRQCIKSLKKNFPKIPIETADERYTSKMAAKTLFESGMGKKKRRNKALLDETSATIILQEYLYNQNISKSKNK